MKVSWLNAVILNQIAPTRGPSNTSRECDQRADGERRYRLAVGEREEYLNLQMPCCNPVQAIRTGRAYEPNGWARPVLAEPME